MIRTASRLVLGILFLSHIAFAEPTDWRHDLENSGGGYWKARIPVTIANDKAETVEGAPVSIRIGKGKGELPLEGHHAEEIRVCDPAGDELLFSITDSRGLPRESDAMRKGDMLSFRTSCPASGPITCRIYFDNPAAHPPYEFSAIRDGVANPGAEIGQTAPEGWTSVLEDGDHSVSLSDETPRGGKRCFKTVVAPGAQPSWVKWVQEGILIHPGKDYILTGWVRAKDLKGKAGWYIHVNGDKPMLINQVLGFEESQFGWRKIEFKFTSPPEAVNASIGTVLFGTGTAWHDDVELKLLDPVPAHPVVIGDIETLELKTAPISREWYVPGSGDKDVWQYRSAFVVRNFSNAKLSNQLIQMDANQLLARMRKGAASRSVRIVDPVQESEPPNGAGGKALPVLAMDNRLCFIGDFAAMSEKTLYVYVTDSPAPPGPAIKYSDLVSGPGNLVRNGGMNKGAETPEGWSCDEEPARENPRCVGRRMLTGGINDGAHIRLEVSPDAARQWTGWRQPGVPVEPGATYLYAGYMKCGGVKEARLHAHIHGADGALIKDSPFFSTNRSVTGTSDWTLSEGTVQMPPEARSVELHLTMLSDGMLDHDEILFQRVMFSKVEDIEARERTDAVKKTSPLTCWQENALVKVFRWTPPPAQTESSLSAALARNEIESLQLVLRSSKPLRRVRVEVGDIKSPDRTSLPKPEIALVGYVPIDYPTSYYQSRKPEWYRKRPTAPPKSDGWADDWPDPLPPAAPFALEPDRSQPVWIMVSAPKDAPAGTYEGRVTISSPDLQKPVSLPLVVTVWNFDLPKTSALKVIYDYRPSFDTMFGAKIDDAYFEKWYRFLARHRVCPDRVKPEISVGYENGTPVIRSQAYDRMASLCFDELGMNVTYAPGEFYCGGWAYLPTPFLGLEPFTTEYEKAVTACYKAYVAHMKDKGWYDKVIMYMSDEPHCWNNEKISGNLSRCCDIIRKADPDAKVYSSTWECFSGLVGHLNVWGAGPHGSFKVEEIRRQQVAGDTIWYTTDGHMCIDTPCLAIERLLPHLCWKYGVECYEFWGINWYTFNPWERGWHKYIFQSDTGNPKDGYWVRYPNGDGYLVYPGWAIGVDGPVSSIRLEQAREGIEDYEYFVLLDRLIKEAEKQKIAVPDARKAMEIASALVVIPNAGGCRSTELMPDPDAVMDARAALAREIVLLNKRLEFEAK